jgi:hypothetical protein
MVPSHGEQHQLLRILYWQEPQQNLIQQGKNGGVRPNPQRQRHHRHGHKTGAPPQRSQGIPEIANRRPHPLLEAHEKRLRSGFIGGSPLDLSFGQPVVFSREYVTFRFLFHNPARLAKD